MHLFPEHDNCNRTFDIDIGIDSDVLQEELGVMTWSMLLIMIRTSVSISIAPSVWTMKCLMSFLLLHSLPSKGRLSSSRYTYQFLLPA